MKEALMFVAAFIVLLVVIDMWADSKEADRIEAKLRADEEKLP